MSDSANHDETSDQELEPMELPGRRLRETREARGLSVQDVASNLRLSSQVIRALEQDDYAALPSATFVSGYLRAYARLLEISESELSLPRQAVSNPRLVKSVSTASEPRSRQFPMRLISVLIVLALLASSVVWWINHGNELLFERDDNGASSLSDTRPHLSLPERVVSPPELSAVPSPLETPAEPVDPAPAGAEPTREAEPAAAEPVPVADESAAPVLVQANMELRYQGDSWTEITDNTGERLAFGLVERGTVLQLVGEAPFSIQLGYAPAVEVIFNDEVFDHRPFQRRGVARFNLGGPEHNRPVTR